MRNSYAGPRVLPLLPHPSPTRRSSDPNAWVTALFGPAEGALTAGGREVPGQTVPITGMGNAGLGDEGSRPPRPTIQRQTGCSGIDAEAFVSVLSASRE